MFLGLVAGEYFGDVLLVGVVGGGSIIVGGVALVLLAADDGLDGFGFEGFVASKTEVFDNTANEGNLVVGIVDDEIAVEIQSGVFDTEYFDGDAVKGTHIGHETSRCGSGLVL